MGVVFKARQVSLNRIVALKMILAGRLASPEQVRRFRLEAEEAGRLDHPHIVPIYQVGEHQGQHYFSMKLVDGGSLQGQVGRLTRAPFAAARLVAAVARAVHYAHQHGILHRDLKPGNILVDSRGQPHVTDFGLAKHLEGGGATQSGVILGTPGYMAPEQAAARKNLTTAADVYGLGAVLYECLTGRPPFEGATTLDTLLQAMEQDPPRVRALNPKVPADLETVCLKCLEKDPARRYPSAQALADDLDRFLADEPVLARPTGRLGRAARWVRRRPAAAALLAVTALAVLVVSAGGWWYNVRLQRALAEAQERREEADRERATAEQRRRDADHQRQVADGQRERATAGFRNRLETVDDLLINVDGRLANMADMGSVRMEFLREFLLFSQNLEKEQPGDPSARRQLGRLYARIGDVCRESGRYREGDQWFQQAVGVQQALAKDIPQDPRYRDDLSLTHAQHAELLRAAGRVPQARAACEAAVKLQDELAAGPPERPQHRALAARRRYDLARLCEAARLPGPARQAYEQALAAQRRLAQDSRDDPQPHSALGRTAAGLALLRSEAGPAESRRLFDEALAAQRRARRLAPDVQRYGRELRETYDDLADSLEGWGRHDELARLAADLQQDFPDDMNELYNAACFLANAAKVAGAAAGVPPAERGRLADGYGRQAVGLLQKAVQAGYNERTHMDADSDLHPLRGRADFKAVLADLDKRRPAPLTPAGQFEALVQEYQAAQRMYRSLRGKARTAAQRQKAALQAPRLEGYARRFLELAQKHPESPAAVNALAWVLDRTEPTAGKPPAPALLRLRREALEVLERDHLQKAEMVDVCKSLAGAASPDCDKLLRGVEEKHGQPEVRGVAGLALALSLARQAERERPRRPDQARELAGQAERQLEQVIKRHDAVTLGSTTIGEFARERLHELRHLAVGRPAQDIEGEDLDGKKFRLQDYRGKVVVLDFWANWCGYCRQMYPQERQMVQRMQGRPFALLGVNRDDDRDQARRAVQKYGLSWRSWWDGGPAGGRIATPWQVDSFPTVYVLDHKGVIRYKHEGQPGPELDATVDKLVRECEAERGKK
jgi:peroxiredoxin/tetratricopeptide (TPR) repeat protein